MLMHQHFVVGHVDAERLVRCHIAVFPLDVLLLRLHGGEHGIGVLGCVAQRLALRELALHFERGRNAPKAVQYLEHTGKVAVGRSAPRKAVQHFTKAIGLLTTWPDASERRQHELSLQLMRGVALMATQGLAAPEVAYAYARAWDLCQQLGEASQTFAVMTGLFTFHTGRGDVPKGHECAEQCLRLAEQDREPALLLQAHRSLGSSLFYLGRFITARKHL